MRNLLAVSLTLLLGAYAAAAVGAVTVSDAWVRGVVASQTATGAYLTVTSTTATTLVGVASPAAETVEMHEMMMHGDMMMMHPVKRIAIPANGKVDFAPNGYHIMLIGLKRPLVDGQKIPLTLTFEDAAGAQGSTTVEAVVRPLAEGAEHDHMKM